MADKIVNIADSVTVGELAETLGLSVTALIGELFKNGIAATINQRLDFETAQIIVEELKLDVTLKRKEAALEVHRTHQLSDKAVSRSPIVAVMGHVDHGKTSLLDAILDKKTVYYRGQRTLNISLDNHIKYSSVMFLIHHFQDVSTCHIGCGS
jgi:translation initiation factor IF-2